MFKNSMSLSFSLGTLCDGSAAPSDADIELEFDGTGAVRLDVTQTRRDLVDPVSGYGTDTESVSLVLTREEALHLSSLLEQAARSME